MEFRNITYIGDQSENLYLAGMRQFPLFKYYK